MTTAKPVRQFELMRVFIILGLICIWIPCLIKFVCHSCLCKLQIYIFLLQMLSYLLLLIQYGHLWGLVGDHIWMVLLPLDVILREPNRRIKWFWLSLWRFLKVCWRILVCSQSICQIVIKTHLIKVGFSRRFWDSLFLRIIVFHSYMNHLLRR
jgi:hypothetical protein